MKKCFIIFAILAVPLAMVAQERSGNITGTVSDPDGNPLPGVTVTLTGNTIAPIQSITSGEGRFRFLSLFPGKDYQIKMELQGFKTRTETGIIVNVNQTADLRLTMEIGKIEEEVTVIAQTPVVQAKKTQVQSSVNYEMLQSLPSARDPWAMLLLAPSVYTPRTNVGGTEAGTMSPFQSKGTANQEWNIDGMQITDKSSHTSPGYFDFDAFEEMQVSTGVLDVEHKEGIAINLISRRGGNKTSLGGRFFYTDEKFQSTISAERLAEIGLQADRNYNHAIDMKDFGFNAGGPVLKDKIWWWAAYGIQQINAINITNVNDKTFLTNYAAKLNVQIIPENRAEIFFMAADKKKWGRNSDETFPPGWTQGTKFHFGNPTFKFQDEHMFGDDLFLSIRYGSSNAGFGMVPGNDENLSAYIIYDESIGVYSNSQWYFYSDRPHPYGVLQAQYFSENLFNTGTTHEIKLGIEINNNARTYVGGYPGNFHLMVNSPAETGDWNGDGTIDVTPWLTWVKIVNNDLSYHEGTNRMAVYASDAISFGRFNFNLGIRIDREKPYVDEWTTTSLFKSDTPYTDDHQKNYADIAASLFTAKTIDLIRAILPIKTAPYVEVGKIYTMISPRFGVTYDLFGTGKTILKAAYSLYPGSGLDIKYWQVGGMYPSMGMYWDDANGDGLADYTELYWQDISNPVWPFYRLFDDDGNFQGNLEREYGNSYKKGSKYIIEGFWFGWDQSNPSGTTKSNYYIDTDTWKPSQTHELFASIEHEIRQDFGVSLSFTWNRMGRYSWDRPYYPLEFYPTLSDHVRSKDDYETLRNVPSTLVDPVTGKTYDPGEAAGRPWYVLKAGPETLPTSYSKAEMMDSTRYDVFWGFDLVLNKRLSDKWMMNGSFTYQMQRAYFGDNGYNVGANGYTDPTNLWVYEGQILGYYRERQGSYLRQGFSRWMLKLTGLYQLPFDINVSGTLSAHEGYYVGTSFGILDRTLPNSRSNSNTMYTSSFDNWTHLDDIWQVSLKVEKAFRLGDASRMYFSIDLFNVLNLQTILGRYDLSLGTFRYSGTAPISRTPPKTNGSGSGNISEIMNPFIFRLGIRFQI